VVATTSWIIFGKFVGMASVLGKLKFDDEKRLAHWCGDRTSPQTAQNSMPGLTLFEQSIGIHPAPSATVLNTGPHDLDRRMIVDMLYMCCLRGARKDGVILNTELRECKMLPGGSLGMGGRKATRFASLDGSSCG
jgi:hypothetical protein